MFGRQIAGWFGATRGCYCAHIRSVGPRNRDRGLGAVRPIFFGGPDAFLAPVGEGFKRAR